MAIRDLSRTAREDVPVLRSHFLKETPPYKLATARQITTVTIWRRLSRRSWNRHGGAHTSDLDRTEIGVDHEEMCLDQLGNIVSC